MLPNPRPTGVLSPVSPLAGMPRSEVPPVLVSTGSSLLISTSTSTVAATGAGVSAVTMGLASGPSVPLTGGISTGSGAGGLESGLDLSGPAGGAPLTSDLSRGRIGSGGSAAVVVVSS